MTEKYIESDISTKAIEFRDMCYESKRRIDEHDDRFREVFARLISLSEMLENRKQRNLTHE